MRTRAFAGAVMTPSLQRIEAEIAAQGAARGAGKTICPSEVARALAGDWRGLMPQVRGVATGMATRGEITAPQRGVPVDAVAAKGPIRLGLPPVIPG